MHALPYANDLETGNPIFRNPESMEGLIETTDPDI